MKKLVSMLLVLAMLVTVFAGLAITASAADAVLTVYTQAGADGRRPSPRATPPKSSRSSPRPRLTATAISTSRRASRTSSSPYT